MFFAEEKPWIAKLTADLCPIFEKSFGWSKNLDAVDSAK